MDLIDLKRHLKHGLGGGSIGGSIDDVDVINEGGRYFYSMHAWKFAERPSVTVSTVANQDYVDLPADFGSLIKLLSNTIEVKMTTYSEVAERQATRVSASSASLFWATIVFPGGEPQKQVPRLLLSPTPASVDELTLYYRATWTDLYEDTDTANVPRFAETALVQVVREFGRGYRDDDLSERMTKLESNALIARLRQADGRQQESFGEMTGGAWGPRHVPNPLLTEALSPPS